MGTEELPDDYFTPTISDLQARQAQLHARVASLNNAPLQSRTQREDQAKAKRDRWPNVRPPPPPSSSPPRANRCFRGRTKAWRLMIDGLLTIMILSDGIRRPSGCASPTSHSLRRRSRRATRYAPYTRSYATLCARTSSPSSSSWVCVCLYLSLSLLSIRLIGHSRSVGSVLLFLGGSHISPPLQASNPPPRDLKVSDPAVRDLTLAELGLAPSSVLHLRFVDDALNRAFSFSFFFFSYLPL